MNTTPANDTKPIGAKYDRSRDVAAVAKLVRLDIAAAITVGALPVGLKCSVKIERYSLGSTIRVTVTDAPGVVFLSVKRVRHDVATNYGWTTDPILSPVGAGIVATLEAIVGAYNRDDSGSLNGYSKAFGQSVGFCTDLTDALRAEIVKAVYATSRESGELD